jgi:hypothetical protein
MAYRFAALSEGTVVECPEMPLDVFCSPVDPRLKSVEEPVVGYRPMPKLLKNQNAAVSHSPKVR